MDLRKFGRLPDLELVIRRFPIAVALMGLMTLSIMLFQNMFYDMDLVRLCGGFILAGYLCVCVQLAFESRRQDEAPQRWIWKLGLSAGAIGLGGQSVPLGFNIILAILAAIALLGNAASIGQRRENGRVWLFTQKLWTGAIFAFVGSIIFTLGIIAIMETVRTLFDVRLDSLVERLILPIGLAFLAPVYWMGTLPHPRKVGEELSELSFEARALAFLGIWLLAPLTIIYGLVILAYALRILVSWELPDGEIGMLVTPFMAVGTLTWLMLEPSVMKTGPFVGLYRRIWFPIMGVASALLLIAVGVRVGEYGLTPERFMLIVYGLGALILALGFGLRPRGDIRIPTLVAALFFGVTAFLGKPLADWNQYQRVQDGLKDLAAEGAIQKIREGTIYLVNHDREDWARKMFPDYDGEEVVNSWTGEWHTFLDEKGYISEEYRDQINAAETWGNVNYVFDEPSDLSATPRLIAKRTVSYYPDMNEETLQTNSNTVFFTDDALIFDFEGEMVRVNDEGQIARLYAERPNAEDKTQNEVPGAPVFDFEFSSGLKGRLVFLNLGLNGEGNDLRGVYGEALIFTE